MKFDLMGVSGEEYRIYTVIKEEHSNQYMKVIGGFLEPTRNYTLLASYCHRCSQPNESECDSCRSCRDWNSLDRVVALGEYVRKGKSEMSRDILDAKDGEEPICCALAAALATLTTEKYPDLLECAFVIPMPRDPDSLEYKPMHHEAILTRAYCQALGMRYSADLLSRKGQSSMKGLGLVERRHVAQKEIHARKGVELRGEDILIIDDILTTGSSMDRCACELKRIGAGNVFGLVVGRTR